VLNVEWNTSSVSCLVYFAEIFFPLCVTMPEEIALVKWPHAQMAPLAFVLAAVVMMLLAILAYKNAYKRKKKVFYFDGQSSLPLPPGPKPFPILGSIHHLGKHDIPFKGFTELAKV
jgi:hypothetical protein